MKPFVPRIGLTLVMMLPAPLRAQVAAYPFSNPSLPAAKRIDNLVSLMTLDEKINALSTNSAVPRLGVESFGSSEAFMESSNEKLGRLEVEKEPASLLLGESSKNIKLTAQLKVQ